MSQKFLYIVDHGVPFPSSEYGGIWNVIAEDDEECFDLISEHDQYSDYEEYFSNLRENILKARVFPLSDDEIESGVIECFVT